MSILPNSGITISAVRTALGENTNDLGNLCKSSRVSQWSFNKPVDSPKLTLNHPQDWYAVNDGFAINTYNDPFDLLEDFLRGIGNCWDYEKPSGGSASPYRLGDFRNYNSTAGMWFQYQFENSQSTAYKNEVRHVINNSSNPAVDIQGILNNFPAFRAISPAYNPQGSASLAFLIVAANSSGGVPQVVSGCEVYKICNVLDYDDDKQMSFTVPSDLNGKYWFVPVIVSQFYGSEKTCVHLRREDLPYYFQGATWYPLPANYFALTLSSTPYTPTLDFTTDISSMTVSFDYNGNDEISNLEGDISFSFSSPQSWDNDSVAVTVVSIRYTNSPTQPYMNMSSMTATPQPPTNTTTNSLHFNHKDSFVALRDNWKDEDEMPFVVTFTVYKNGVSQTYTLPYSATVV